VHFWGLEGNADQGEILRTSYSTLNSGKRNSVVRERQTEIELGGGRGQECEGFAAGL